MLLKCNREWWDIKLLAKRFNEENQKVALTKAKKLTMPFITFVPSHSERTFTLDIIITRFLYRNKRKTLNYITTVPSAMNKP